LHRLVGCHRVTPFDAVRARPLDVLAFRGTHRKREEFTFLSERPVTSLAFEAERPTRQRHRLGSDLQLLAQRWHVRGDQLLHSSVSFLTVHQ
jgi:hypothetical protein